MIEKIFFLTVKDCLIMKANYRHLWSFTIIIIFALFAMSSEDFNIFGGGIYRTTCKPLTSPVKKNFKVAVITTNQVTGERIPNASIHLKINSGLYEPFSPPRTDTCAAVHKEIVYDFYKTDATGVFYWELPEITFFDQGDWVSFSATHQVLKDYGSDGKNARYSDSENVTLNVKILKNEEL